MMGILTKGRVCVRKDMYF